MDDVIRPWTKVGSRPVGSFRIFDIRSDTRIHPRTGREHDLYVIESVDWVTACAVTEDGCLVMVEQFRHGSESMEIEVPGGMMDADDIDPVATAVRELREETGYTGASAIALGHMHANAAIMNNKCHTILVTGARLTHPRQLDAGEDIAVRLVPLDEVPRLVASGRVRHSIALAALHHFDLWRRGYLAPMDARPASPGA